MNPNRTHLRILRQLSRREYESVVALSKDLEKIPSTVDISLKVLLDMGLVEMTRTGKSVSVSMGKWKHAQTYKKLVTLHPHMGFEEILSGHNIKIMLTLLGKRSSMKELAGKLGVSERTVTRSIRSMRSYGIVGNEGGSYLLNDQHENLYEFVRELQAHMNMKKAISCDPGATVIWENLEEFVLETLRSVDMDGFLATGYGTLERYGIPLLTDHRYHYFHSPYKRDLRLEDVCIHIFLLNPSSVRASLYVSLAIIRNIGVWDWKYLESESRKYQLDDVAGRLRTYIENQGKVKPEFFPSWNELKEKAGDYDIHV